MAFVWPSLEHTICATGRRHHLPSWSFSSCFVILLTVLSISVNTSNASRDKDRDTSSMCCYHSGRYCCSPRETLKKHHTVQHSNVAPQARRDPATVCCSVAHFADDVGHVTTGHLQGACAAGKLFELLRRQTNTDFTINHSHGGWSGSFSSHDGLHLLCCAALKN